MEFTKINNGRNPINAIFVEPKSNKEIFDEIQSNQEKMSKAYKPKPGIIDSKTGKRITKTSESE